jgi:hypothetical protein
LSKTTRVFCPSNFSFMFQLYRASFLSKWDSQTLDKA